MPSFKESTSSVKLSRAFFLLRNSDTRLLAEDDEEREEEEEEEEAREVEEAPARSRLGLVVVDARCWWVEYKLVLLALDNVRDDRNFDM